MMANGTCVESPKTEAEWRKYAQLVVDCRPKSYVESAKVMARFVLNALTPERDHMQLIENFNATSTRCSALLEDRRTLQRLIEKVAVASGQQREDAINTLVETSRSYK